MQTLKAFKMVSKRLFYVNHTTKYLKNISFRYLSSQTHMKLSETQKISHLNAMDDQYDDEYDYDDEDNEFEENEYDDNQLEIENNQDNSDFNQDNLEFNNSNISQFDDSDNSSEFSNLSKSDIKKDERVFLWEQDMIQFWEEIGFKSGHQNIFISLGHGRFSSPKLLTSYKIDINQFAEYTLEECKHLRDRYLMKRHLENMQKLFPKMILNKAIYYNPYILTLKLFTLKKKKNDLIDLISTHLAEINNPHKYNYFFDISQPDNIKNNNNKSDKSEDTSILTKSEIIELMDWDKIFENLSFLLTTSFNDIIKQIHILRKLLCNNGLSQIEFIELFEIYPSIFRLDIGSFFGKFRLLTEYGGSGILRKRRIIYDSDIDFTLIGSQSSMNDDRSEIMLNDDRILYGYQIIIKYLISIGYIFDYSWVRISRIKYWQYNNELKKKYKLQEIIKMKCGEFINCADYHWKEYCHKTKKKYFENMKLDENWRDNDIDRYMDYEEFIKNELRTHYNMILKYNKNDCEDTKKLLKKNKIKLREPFLNKYSKNIKQQKEEKEYNNDKATKKTLTLIQKEERRNYFKLIKRLETLHGLLCRNAYTPQYKDLRNFLKNNKDFGFNYQLKYDKDNVDFSGAISNL